MSTREDELDLEMLAIVSDLAQRFGVHPDEPISEIGRRAENTGGQRPEDLVRDGLGLRDAIHGVCEGSGIGVVERECSGSNLRRMHLR